MEIKDLMKDTFAQLIVREFDIQDEEPEVQASLIERLGENIMLRITTEIMKIVPEGEHEQFTNLIGSGDLPALQAFLQPYIPNFDVFVQGEARKEIEETKKLMS